MLTCLNSAPKARNAATVCAEKPHCGKSGVPFMKSTTGAEPSSALILSTTSIYYLVTAFGRAAAGSKRPLHIWRRQGAGHEIPSPRVSARRFLSSAITRHCSAALMDVQRPISSAVRRHPIQYPCSSSEQILVQGDRGRSHSAGACASDILGNYEAAAAMFKPSSWRRIRACCANGALLWQKAWFLPKAPPPAAGAHP